MTAKAPPYLQPPAYLPLHVAAIQALLTGTASAHQQKSALDWIINAAAGTYDLSFNPDSERGTAFAEGRRFVGLEIVKLTKISVEKLKQG